MEHDPSMRASDADRDGVAALLREHCAEGRLTIEEFQERLDRAYEAKTYGDLHQLTVDLPKPDEYDNLPVPASSRTRPERKRGQPVQPKTGRGLAAVWGTWAFVNAICVTIWLISSLSAGEVLYFWPMWVAGPWGAVLLFGTLATRHGGRGHEGRPH